MSLSLQHLINSHSIRSVYKQSYAAGLSNSWVYFPGNSEVWTSDPGTNNQKKANSDRSTNRFPDSILNTKTEIMTHNYCTFPVSSM